MVEAVEILAQSVHAVVAVEDAIGVEDGDDEEVEVVPEFECIRMGADEELDHTIECVAGAHLTRVHSRCHQHHRLVYFPEMLLQLPAREQSLDILLGRVGQPLSPRQSQQMQRPPFIIQTVPSLDSTRVYLLK